MLRGLRDLSSPTRDWTPATAVKATGPPGNTQKLILEIYYSLFFRESAEWKN